MPPRARKSGAPKSAKRERKIADDSVDTPSRSSASLNERIRELEAALAREREERNYFQLERDRINTFWSVTKQELDDSRAEVRRRDRDMETQEERHEMEIKVYKQRLKSLLYEQQTSVVDLKISGEQTILHAQEEHRQQEGQLRREQRALKLEVKDLALSHEEIIKNLKMENDKIISRLRSEFERQLAEMHKKYEDRMEELRQDLETRRKTEILEIEERKNQHIQELMRNHELAFLEMKNYYQEITHSNLDLIKALKDEVAELRRKEAAAEKRYQEVMLENKRLVEPLHTARKEAEELRKLLASYEKDKTSLQHAKAQLRSLQQEKADLTWQLEVLTQKSSKVETDRNALHERLMTVSYDQHQKLGFKNLLLERRVQALADELEKKEARLSEILNAANLDPAALGEVTRKLEDVLESKNMVVKELRFELDRVTKAHNDLIRVYEVKLSEYGIPVEELGFQPLETRTSTMPAGLVT